MTEAELDELVRQNGIERTEHVAKTLRELMPDIIYTKAGGRTLAFITALESACRRAQRSQVSRLDGGVKGTP